MTKAKKFLRNLKNAYNSIPFFPMLLIWLTGLGSIFFIVFTRFEMVYEGIAWNIIIGAISICLATIVTLCFSRPKEPTILDCPYWSHLDKMGIRHIYLSRDDSEKDLINEFNKLSYRHLKKNNPEPIKMIGVTLNLYFNNESKIYKTINENNELSFEIFISSPENNEIVNRYNVSKKMKSEELTAKTLDESTMIQLIKDTRIKLKRLEEERENFKVIDYEFSPYATAVFINGSIYYTPNMLHLDNFGFEDKTAPRETTRNNDITLWLNRDSDFGKKLEELFDNLWTYENNVKNYDETA